MMITVSMLRSNCMEAGVNASPNGQLSGTIIMEGGNGVNSAGLASIRHSWTPHARTTLRPWSRTIAKVLPPMPRKVRNIQDIGMERNYFARGIFFFTSAYVYSFTFAFVLCKIPAILFSLSLSLSLFRLHPGSLGGIASVGVMLAKNDEWKELSKWRSMFQSFIKWSERVIR